MKTRSCAPLLCVLVAGCGGGGNGRPEPIEGPAKQVAALVQRLEKATAQHDFATICSQLLAASTRRQAGGSDCPDVLGQRAGNVHQPKIRIQAIELRGNQAQVRVRTTAAGQAPTTDVIRLVRESGRYRILALGR